MTFVPSWLQSNLRLIGPAGRRAGCGTNEHDRKDNDSGDHWQVNPSDDDDVVERGHSYSDGISRGSRHELTGTCAKPHVIPIRKCLSRHTCGHVNFLSRRSWFIAQLQTIPLTNPERSHRSTRVIVITTVSEACFSSRDHSCLSDMLDDQRATTIVSIP